MPQIRRLTLHPECRRNLQSCLFILIIMLIQTVPAFCATAEPLPFNFDKTQAKIKELSRQIKNGPVSPQQIESAKQQTEQLSQGAAACIDSSTGQIGRLDQELTSLGPTADREPAEIIKERKSLTKQKQALQVTLSECRLVATLATRLQNELNDQNKILQTANFFSKTQNFFGRSTKALPTFVEFNDQLIQYITDQSGWQELTPWEILIVLLLAGTGVVTGAKLFRIVQDRLRACGDSKNIEQTPLLKGHLSLPGTTASLLTGCFLLYVHRAAPSMVYGPWLLLSLCFFCFSLFLFHLRNCLEYKKSSSAPTGFAMCRFRLLVFLGVVLFFSTSLDLSDFQALESLLTLVQTALISGICLSGWWFFWSFRLSPGMIRFEKSFKAGISAFAVLAMISELSGYRNFSIFLLVGCFGTFLLFSLLRFILFFIDEAVGGFFSGKYQWQQRMRLRLGLAPQENLPGIMWLNLIFKLLAWLIALFLLLQLWGLSAIQRQQITSYLINGVSFGGLTIAPARIVLGFFIFACGWTLVSWIKMWLDKKLLRHASFSQSAQETLVTITGYAGFALVLIVGLSVAGVSFSNLAVIAGALSIGIGFGLQNIVNNFVSGLIILFERPVKRGDWIRVGTTEGYVQKISVRSTLIQTFDRSDVIVPNSELISNQVTNMMLNDNQGRLIVPIGVAYGSDTDLVRTILLDIAKANEKVINDDSAPKPQVLFMEFGESSLNFELRCHLVNIDERLMIKSAINYEIDRAFRKHNISIPFPQRDLYIKEFPRAERTAEDK
jgi:potassium-dependent mechanosensitive channel